MLDKVEVSTFAEHVGSAFMIRPDNDAPMRLELTEARALEIGARPFGAPQRKPFSLLFKGPRDPVLPQQMYKMDHGTLGEFTLFVVPVGQDEKGTYYEAIFN